MDVFDYILGKLSGLFRFNNHPLYEKAYSIMLHVAMKFIRIVLDRCSNKPLIVVDRGPWYRWALDRLGLKYQYQRFSLRNIVERSFGSLKQRTRRFYNNINSWKIQSIEDYASTIAIIRNLHTTIKTQGDVLPSRQDLKE